MRLGRMVQGGLCLSADDDGAPVLVEGGIPGEDVDVRVRYRKGKTAFASVVAVTAASAHRVLPPCPYVPECGGCQLQHIDYEHQLSLKRDIVIDALRRQRVPSPDAIDVDGMDEPWRYRLRGEFHVVRDAASGAPAGLGFNRARSWRPIAVADCLIHERSITGSLAALTELARTGNPELATLHVTAGEDGAELLLRAKPRRAVAAEAIDEAARRAATPRLSTDSTSLTWRGLTYRVTPDTFIQANWAQMDVLYTRVLAGLGDYTGLRIVDAYAGVGVLAAYVARDARDVVCVESNRSAARTGVLNARLNGVEHRMHYVLGTAETALPALGSDADIDGIVLDPPRAGCDGRVTAWLALTGPDVVVYISCDPATLARDLHILAASGPYTIEHLAVVDMFPQTYHVECVATLRRAR